MTEEQINIAIQESICGKTNSRDQHGNSIWTDDNGYVISFPDYYNDLNAMRVVVLEGMNNGGGAWAKYLEHLRTVCKIPHSHVCLALVEASAAQRAEAYLKTIGKWESTTTT